MNTKKLAEKLSVYKFLPESGRACWYCYARLIILQTVELGEPWAINYKNIDTSFGSYSDDHIVKWFFISKDEMEFTNFIECYLATPKLLEDLKTDTDDLKNLIVTLVGNKKFSAYTNTELGSLLSDYLAVYKQFFKSSMTLRKIDRGVIATLRKNFPSDKADEIIRTVSTSEEPSFSLQEEIAVLKSAKLIKERGLHFDSAEFEQKIEELTDKYAWSVLGYYKELPNTKETYENRLRGLMSEDPKSLLDKLNERNVEDKGKRRKLIKEFSYEQKKIAHIASAAAHLKDFVKSRINESQYHSEPLFAEIAARIGKSADYIKDLDTTEIKTLLTGGDIDETLVRERTKENFLIALDGKFQVFIGPDAAYLKKKCVESALDNGSKELKGRVASIGHARGRAVVVHDVEDFGKVLDNDVLIVMNTSPDFMPVIRKAKAIIAEEGGITAHVSVVSREFGIPCIVGINNVTRLIKDGDVVEVDANAGVVKILKKG